ncbi:MAG: DedA family protein [Candidatus Sericytochromatia bacterium]|nr:DedA family protein [Candidatus Sericytochromatia bacterium]
MTNPIDFILHVDKHLLELVGQYGAATLGILFGIIFCETGLVVTPFLPGDSLLFAAGALAGDGKLPLGPMWLLLWFAAVAGDNLNYAVGRHLGPRVFQYEDSRFFRRKHLDRTREYYAMYGAKTLVIGRFMPIVRTFAPFVAGIGQMHYPKFLSYSVLGGFLWMSTFIFGGYYFGALPVVQKNFKLVILAVIGLSFLPMVFEAWRHRQLERRGAAAGLPTSADS